MSGKVGIGIVGLGSIKDLSHVPEFMACEGCEIVALCDTNEDALLRAARDCDVPPERLFRDYRQLVSCGDVDAVVVAAPNCLHFEIAEAAIRAGKAVCVEKPMAMSYREAVRLCEMAEAARVVGVVCFSWRYRANVRRMKALLASGAIGDLYHLYVRCVKSSALTPGRKLEWRFDRRRAGYGVSGDFQSHMVDITNFLGLSIESVCADVGTVIKERELPDGSGMGVVTTDDYCNVVARLSGGVSASYQVSRLTRAMRSRIVVELHGSLGAVVLEANGWRPDQQTLTLYVDGATVDDGNGVVLGVPDGRTSRPTQAEAFVEAVRTGDASKAASLRVGVENQCALDAILLSSEERRWVSLDELRKEREVDMIDGHSEPTS